MLHCLSKYFLLSFLCQKQERIFLQYLLCESIELLEVNLTECGGSSLSPLEVFISKNLFTLSMQQFFNCSSAFAALGMVPWRFLLMNLCSSKVSHDSLDSPVFLVLRAAFALCFHLLWIIEGLQTFQSDLLFTYMEGTQASYMWIGTQRFFDMLYTLLEIICILYCYTFLVLNAWLPSLPITCLLSLH